jgi:leader peptidase (prepilin peptidase)/N-methyltransferase
MEAVLAGIVGFLLGGLGTLFVDKAYSETPLLGKLRACGYCGRPAGVLDAFPMLRAAAGRARCPSCARRSPWYALALPPAAALAAVVAWLTGDTGVDRAFALAFGMVFLLLMVTDLDRRLLPNRIVYPSVLVALLASPWWSDRGTTDALLGAAVGFGLMLGPYLLMPGGLGAGDVKLGALMGAVLGFPAVLVGIALGVLAGGIGALGILLVRRGARRTTMAYGPFLAAGALAALWWGPAIVNWYMGT